MDLDKHNLSKLDTGFIPTSLSSPRKVYADTKISINTVQYHKDKTFM